jgi:hypothetical protein
VPQTNMPPFEERRIDHMALIGPTVEEVLGHELLRLMRLDWLPVLLKWLRRYAGIETYLDHVSDHPVNAIVNYLRQLMPPLDDEGFVIGLARLPFTTYSIARHVEGELWDPTHEHFLTFQARGVAVWQAMKEPNPKPIETWLLAQLHHGDYYQD